jgi:hypothetical protein
VAKYLADFAASNDLKLQSQGPQLLGSSIWEFQPSSLLQLFEDASDIAVLDLFYQIHPTEVTSNSILFLLSAIVLPFFICMYNHLSRAKQFLMIPLLTSTI